MLAAVNRPSTASDTKYANTLRQDVKVKSGRISTPHMQGRKNSASLQNKDELTYAKGGLDSPKTTLYST